MLQHSSMYKPLKLNLFLTSSIIITLIVLEPTVASACIVHVALPAFSVMLRLFSAFKVLIVVVFVSTYKFYLDRGLTNIWSNMLASRDRVAF